MPVYRDKYRLRSGLIPPVHKIFMKENNLQTLNFTQ